MSSTPAPWMADAPQLLTGVLTHLVRAQLLTGAGDTIDLDLVDGTLTFDDTRSPRVSARLTAKVPDDAALLSRIDPRTGVRLLVFAGYRRPGGLEDVQQVADLALRARRVSRPDNRLSLEAASDESLVIDCSYVLTGQLTQSSTAQAIRTVVQQVLPGATVTASTPAGPAVDQQQADTDRWDTIQDLADQQGWQVYDDGLRGWHIDAAPQLASTGLSLAVGPGGTITASDAGLDRDTWANWVVLRYKWTSTTGAALSAVGSQRITSGPYSATSGNVKIAYLERNTPSTNALATQAAAALVARMVTRGRSLAVTAPSAYWLRPGDTVLVTLPTGDPELALASSVTFDLRTGLMDVTTRNPDNTGSIGA